MLLVTRSDHLRIVPPSMLEVDTVHLCLGAGRDIACIELRPLILDSILQVETTFFHPPLWDVLRANHAKHRIATSTYGLKTS